MSLSKKLKDLLEIALADVKNAAELASTIDAAANQKMADFSRVGRDFNIASDYAATDWDQFITGAGTVAVSNSEISGALVLTSGATIGNTTSMQLKNNFQLQVGKAVSFETRVKLNDVSNASMFVGLQSNLSSSHRVGFELTAGSGAIKLVTRTAFTNNTSVTSPKSMTNNTFVLLRWEWDGVSAVNYFVDDVMVGRIVTNIPVNAGAGVTLAVAATAASAEVLSVDFFEAKAARR